MSRKVLLSVVGLSLMIAACAQQPQAPPPVEVGRAQKIATATVVILPDMEKPEELVVFTVPQLLVVKQDWHIVWDVADPYARLGNRVISVEFVDPGVVEDVDDQAAKDHTRPKKKVKAGPGEKEYKYKVLIDGEVVEDPRIVIW